MITYVPIVTTFCPAGSSVQNGNRLSQEKFRIFQRFNCFFCLFFIDYCCHWVTKNHYTEEFDFPCCHVSTRAARWIFNSRHLFRYTLSRRIMVSKWYHRYASSDLNSLSHTFLFYFQSRPVSSNRCSMQWNTDFWVAGTIVIISFFYVCVRFHASWSFLSCTIKLIKP